MRPRRRVLVRLDRPVDHADAYVPAGFADSYVYVVPSLNLVAARIGGRRDAHLRQGVWRALLDLIVAAVRD